jgi:WXG100 family type VII secretion target
MAVEVRLEDRELQDYASNAEVSGQEIATHMSSLMSHLATTPAVFQGAAGKQFTAIQGVMQEKLTNIVDALNDVAMMTRTSGRILNAADSTAATTVSHIMNELMGAPSTL